MEIPSYLTLKLSAFLPNTIKRGENSLILAILVTYEDFIERYYNFWTSLDNFDPMLADENILNWIATQTGNPWRALWDNDWQLDTKRKLLRDTKQIFSKRLFPETLTLLFSHFNLLSYLRPKHGFILGTTNPPASLLPATLGTSILDYEIVVPAAYYVGSIEYNLTKFIADKFGIPGRVPIVFS